MSSPAQQDPLVGKILADRFEILSRIGEGGTGVVYKARQITVDRPVAIKVLGAHVSSDPTWVKRFHNEARAIARLDHPNTVRLIEFGETKDGLLFIAMEFLSGRALAEEISRLGKLPPQRVLRIIIQVCQSLQEAHGLGIIHRDIKPDNIFLLDTKGGSDFVKVLDFSVAKMEDPNAQQTRAGTVFGTPAYMSPEQARGSKLQPQSDIYACGIVAYEMLTGKPPFEAALPMEVVMMHLRQKPAPLVGFPEPLVRVVMRALEKTPERRQQNAEEMIRECQECLDQLFPRQMTGGMQAIPDGAARQAGVASRDQPSNAGPPPSGMLPVQSAGSGPPPPAPVAGGGAPPYAVAGGGAPPMAPPPMAPPPGPMSGGQPVVSANGGAVAAPEQRTIMAQPAPNIPAPNRPGRTQALEADGGGMHRTMFQPGGGVNQPLTPQVLVIRQQVLSAKQGKSSPNLQLFYGAWALLGVSLGFLLHIIFLH